MASWVEAATVVELRRERDTLPRFFFPVQPDFAERKKFVKSNEVEDGWELCRKLDIFLLQLLKKDETAGLNFFLAESCRVMVCRGLVWFPSSQLPYPLLLSSQLSCD